MTDPNPGTVHVMEEEMRAAEQGVFEARSGEVAKKSALDHDANGKAGGSKSGAESTRAKGAAKRKAK